MSCGSDGGEPRQRPISRILQIGELVDGGRYRIKDVVGSGGAGVVYRAQDRELNVEVAVKVIDCNMVPTPEDQLRLTRHIQVARSLHHEHCVSINDDGVHDGHPFHVMQFIEGLSLRQVIDQRHEEGRVFDPSEIQPIIEPLCLALQYAHERTFHGNLKPDNILALPDGLKVTDFALQHGLPKASFLAVQRARHPNHLYLAPEVRSEFEAVNQTADLYSIGVILTEMLTGYVYDDEAPRKLEEALSRTDAELANVLRGCLAQSPVGRFDSVVELQARWQQALPPTTAIDLHTPPESSPQVLPPPTAIEHETQRHASPAPAPEADANTTVAQVPVSAPSLPLESSITVAAPMPAEPPPSAVLSVHDESASTDIDDDDDGPESVTINLANLANLDDDEDDTVAVDHPHEDIFALQAMVEPWLSNLGHEASLPESVMVGPRANHSEIRREATTLNELPNIVFAAASSPPLRSPPPLPLPDPSEDSYRLALENRIPVSGPSLLDIPPLPVADLGSPSIPPRLPSLRDPLEDAFASVPEPAVFEPPVPNHVPLVMPSILEPEPLVRPVTQTPADTRQLTPSDPPPDTRLIAPERTSKPWTGRLLVAFLLVFAVGVALRIVVEQQRRYQGEIALLRQQLDARTRALQASRTPTVPTSEPEPKPSLIPPTPTPEPVPTPVLSCPRGMRLIAGGTFIMGTARDDPERDFDDLAYASITIAPICIDYYEFPNRRGRRPLAAVTWAKAVERCEARGKRLCTEAEWERACKGPDDFRYAYGNDWAPSRCNTRDARGTPGKRARSGAFERCRSSAGLADLAGNVAEWTSTKQDGRYVIKGGGARSPGSASRCAARALKKPGYSAALIGFRCCRNPSKAP